MMAKGPIMSDSPGATKSAIIRGAHNPFAQTVVRDPWADTDGDVPEINLDAFDKCVSVLAEVRTSGTCAGLLLFGDAGSGKTHLLARLRSWLAREMPEAAVFVSVRLETTANRIWRHLRRRMADDLLRKGPVGESRLQNLLSRKLAEFPSPDDFWAGGTWDAGLTAILQHYYEGRHRQYAAAWLRGDSLPESVLARLEVAADPDEEDSLEEQARRIILGLLELASPSVVVFSCDQVEALETAPGDKRGLWAYVQMVSTLHSSARYTLVISSVQSSFMYTFEGAVHQSDWDRIAEHRAAVNPLDWQQGRRLLLARLNSVPELAPVRNPDSLWPLDEAPLRVLFERSPLCLPRKLIHRAREQFDIVRLHTSVIDESIEQYLDRLFQGQWEESLRNGSAHTADDVLGQGLPFIMGLQNHAAEPPPADLHKTLDLVSGEQQDIAICFCNQSPTALPRRLLRIIEDVDPSRFPHQVLIRDGRLPISESARVTRRRLDRLRERGARLVQPSEQAMGALDALRKVMNDAKSGDLAYQGEAVGTEAVRSWIASNMPQPLLDLVEEITGRTSENEQDRVLQEVLALLDEHNIVGVAEASGALQISEERIIDCARYYPAQVGLLAGPPAVVFRFIAESAAGDAHE